MNLSTIGAITLCVADVERSKNWYATVFDQPLLFENEDSAVMDFDSTLINLLHIGQAADLIGPARVDNPESGTHSQFTIWVDDVDAVHTELTRRGVSFTNGPLDRVWGQRQRYQFVLRSRPGFDDRF